MGARHPDHFVPVPPIPGANADAIWFDTGPGGWESYQGFMGWVKCDQDVTLFIESQPVGGTLAVMNGGGAGQAIAANTPTSVKVEFLGYRTRIRVRTGATPPSAAGWHLDGRVTEDEI